MSDVLPQARKALENHDKLALSEKLHDCQRPIWESLLRELVVETLAWKIATHNAANDLFEKETRIQQLEAALERLGDETAKFDYGDYPQEVSAWWMHECLARMKHAREVLHREGE